MESKKTTLVDEEALETQVPLRQKPSKKRADESQGDENGDDDNGDDGGFYDDDEETEEEGSSWSSCDSVEWIMPQEHDTVRLRGTRATFGLIEGECAGIEPALHHQNENDIKTERMGENSDEDNDADESLPAKYRDTFVNVYISLPLPLSQMSRDEYSAIVCSDSPEPHTLRGDLLIGDDLALRRMRNIAVKYIEVIDRPVNCGIVHTLADGRTGITINANIEATVSPICFTNGGAAASTRPKLVGFGKAEETAAESRGFHESAKSRRRAAADGTAPTLRNFVVLPQSGSSPKLPARARPSGLKVDVDGLKAALRHADGSDTKSSRKQQHAAAGDSIEREVPFCDWIVRCDEHMRRTVKPFTIAGEQFFVANPYRTGAVVLYDGPMCDAPLGSDEAANADATSEELEDDSNFGIVRTTFSHLLLQLYVEMSATAFEADALPPDAEPLKQSKVPAADDKLDLSGFELPEQTGPILIALDSNDALDLNCEILGSDRSKTGHTGIERDPDDPARQKCFPTYLDPLSPGHLVDNISLKFIEERATFVYGSIDDLLLRKKSGVSQTPAAKKGKGAKLKQPGRYDGVRVSGVIVMVYPSRIQVVNEVSHVLRDFAPWEVLLLESFRADNCMLGRVGFAVDVNDKFAGHSLRNGGIDLEVETTMGRGKSLAPAKRTEQRSERRQEQAGNEASVASAEPLDEADGSSGDEEEAPKSAADAGPIRRERRAVRETPIEVLRAIMETRQQFREHLPRREQQLEERKKFVLENCRTQIWQPRFGTNYVVGCCTESAIAAREFYQKVGIAFTFEDEAAYSKLESITTPSAKAKKCKFWRNKVQQLLPYLPRLVSINSTRSTMDLILRDGTVLYNLPSTALLESRRNEDLDHDFYPMDVVIPTVWKRASFPISWKPLEGGGDLQVDDRGRPLRYCDVTDELVPVADGEVPRDEAVAKGFADLKCSVYDMQLLYDYEVELQTTEIVYVRRRNDRFFESDLEQVNGDKGVGDKPYERQSPSVIGMVLACDANEQTCDVRWVKQEPDIDCARARFGRMSGEVVELLPNTKVRVLWQDGTMADMWRGELSIVQDADDVTENGDEEEEDEEYADTETSEQPTSHDEVDAAAAAIGPFEELDPAHRNAHLSRIIQMAGAVVSSVAGVFSRGRATSADPPPSDLAPAVPADDRSVPEAAESLAVDEAPASPASPAAAGEFKVCSMFTAHYYRDHAAAEELGATTPARTKRIQREWKNLRDNLPPGVIVKVCEDDLNLLKFAIVGPIHTPYFQSMYFFDLFFPSQFPVLPPRVYFNSFNLRLNPNLYENGHICLSLLGTWPGEATSEGWMPATSTVLQVILSIQSLVLVKEPYYNEAGYEDRKGSAASRERSKAYSESVQHLRLQHMVLTARHPIPDWTYEIRNHFTEFAPKIASRLRALLAAAPASAAEGSITADGVVLPLSKGSIISMTTLLNALERTHAELTRAWREQEEADQRRFDDDDDDHQQ